MNRSNVSIFDLLVSVSGRGTGLNSPGNFPGGTSGLAPSVFNWAGGIQVTFPAFDFFSIYQEKKVQATNHRAEQMRHQQTMEDLSSQIEQAQATFDGARQVASLITLKRAIRYQFKTGLYEKV